MSPDEQTSPNVPVPTRPLLVVGESDISTAWIGDLPFQCTRVPTVAAAREQIRRRLPEVVLVHLLDADPAAVVEAVEALSLLVPQVPILVLQRDEEAALDTRLIDAGAQSVLPADTDAKTATRAIRQAIARHRIRSGAAASGSAEPGAQPDAEAPYGAIGLRLATVAHEVNNAVAIVLGNIEILDNELAVEGRVRATERLARCQAKLGEIHTLMDSLQVGDRVVLPVGLAAPSPGVSRAAKSVQRRRVLVIDDEPMLLDVYSTLLGASYDVVTAEGGLEAVDVLERDQRFNAVLCDLMMPEMSGRQLYDWMRTHTPDLVGRMVFMTAAALTPTVSSFLSRVANPTLRKPIPAKELIDALGRAQQSPAPRHLVLPG